MKANIDCSLRVALSGWAVLNIYAHPKEGKANLMTVKR
jgi:hypothetical protein